MASTSKLHASAWRTNPQKCSSFSSSEESLAPGPLQVLESGSLPLRMRCSLTLRMNNLLRPRQFVHGQCNFFTLHSLARCSSLVYRRLSRSCCRLLLDRGSLLGIILCKCSNSAPQFSQNGDTVHDFVAGLSETDVHSSW